MGPYYSMGYPGYYPSFPPGFSQPYYPAGYSRYPGGFGTGTDQSPTSFEESGYDYSKGGYDPSLAANAPSDYQGNWGQQGQLGAMGDESFAQNPQQSTSPAPEQGGASKQSVGSLDELRSSQQPMPGGNNAPRGSNRFLQQQQQQQAQQQQPPQGYGSQGYPMSNTQSQYNSFPQQSYQNPGFQGQQSYSVQEQQYANQWNPSA